MRIPEPFFVILNPTLSILLRSPFHWLVSKNLMLISVVGRKSGKTYSIPVRYIRHRDTIRFFTGATNKWWRNMRDGADVTLLVEGKNDGYHAVAVESPPDRIREALVLLFKEFPQDAPYYEVRIDKSGHPLPQDLDRAAQNTVMIEARKT